MKTPVLDRSSICRSTSLFREVACRYASTADRGSAAPPVHPGLVPSGQAAGTISSSSGCSGATTMNVAPNTVSGRVVKTSIPDASPDAVATGKSIRAPLDRPIQLRCMILTFSGQSTRSRSSASRSAYAVMRIIHWRRLRRNTGKLPRSERPSLVTSSLDRTVPRPGLQLTGASEV